MSLDLIKVPHCFLEQETELLLLRTDWFQKSIQEWFDLLKRMVCLADKVKFIHILLDIIERKIALECSARYEWMCVYSCQTNVRTAHTSNYKTSYSVQLMGKLYISLNWNIQIFFISSKSIYCYYIYIGTHIFDTIKVHFCKRNNKVNTTSSTITVY